MKTKSNIMTSSKICLIAFAIVFPAFPVWPCRQRLKPNKMRPRRRRHSKKRSTHRKRRPTALSRQRSLSMWPP